MGMLWERFTPKRLRAAPVFRGLKRRGGLRHEFESHRLRHIATPTEPVLDGLCRFWGLGETATQSPSFPQLAQKMAFSQARVLSVPSLNFFIWYQTFGYYQW